VVTYVTQKSHKKCVRKFWIPITGVPLLLLYAVSYIIHFILKKVRLFRLPHVWVWFSGEPHLSFSDAI
jgi:hypothetical protein